MKSGKFYQTLNTHLCQDSNKCLSNGKDVYSVSDAFSALSTYILTYLAIFFSCGWPI